MSSPNRSSDSNLYFLLAKRTVAMFHAFDHSICDGDGNSELQQPGIDSELEVPMISFIVKSGKRFLLKESDCMSVSDVFRTFFDNRGWTAPKAVLHV